MQGVDMQFVQGVETNDAKHDDVLGLHWNILESKKSAPTGSAIQNEAFASALIFALRQKTTPPLGMMMPKGNKEEVLQKVAFSKKEWDSLKVSNLSSSRGERSKLQTKVCIAARKIFERAGN